MADDNFLKYRIRATQLDKVDLGAMIALDLMGNEAFDLMKRRVTTRHTDERGRPLPAYRVKVDKVLDRPSNKPSKERNRGAGWNESEKKSPPPDIYIQIRKLGGVNKKGTDFKGGTPIHYSPSSAVREKRGQVWGMHWDTKEAYLAANYGGPAVDVKRTGKMWASRQIKPKATRSGNPSVTVGFKGAVPKGSIFTLLQGPGQTKSGKDRKANASYRALLANSRGPDGKPTMTNPQEWLGMTDGEMGKVLNVLGTDLMRDLDKVPVKVVVKS